MSGRRAITLVARREIRERLRGRAFLVSTLIMLLLVGGTTALNGALSKEKTYRVAVTAPGRATGVGVPSAGASGDGRAPARRGPRVTRGAGRCRACPPGTSPRFCLTAGANCEP